MYNDTIIGIGQGIGMIGLVGVYVWLKVWMYKREYSNKENKNQNENK
jgi:hypothetical protein